ncbi:hypothetical protein EsHS_00002830 [Epichloe bromicola]
MQESANQGHDSRLDPSGQSPTPAAPLRGNKMPSAAGFGNQDQTNMLQNNYGAASQQPFAELGMASPTTQQAYQGVFDLLTPMSNALPALNHRPHQTAHYMHGSGQPYNPATSPMTHQLPPMPVFGVPSMSMPIHPYYIGQTQLPPFYHGGHSSHPHSQPEMHGRSNMVYYPNQMIMNHAQSNFYHQQGGHFPQHAFMMPANVSSRSYMVGASKSDVRISQYGGASTNRRSRNEDVSSAEKRTVRGPPRKPRQSGHALWIGNLPPQTDLMALVQHICQEAPGMESLFLISKSNCAFANYKDEATCSTAQPKLHDSKFQSVRLVSRLRRNTEGSSGTTAPIVPAAEAVSGATSEQPDVEDEASTGEEKTTATGNTEVTNPVIEPTKDMQTRSNGDKFFILKSLTTEDLDLSVRTGLWATQSHNEESLNRAFQGADNVYLIFSANKSGEYFGYARMQSEMNDDPAAAIEFAPKVMVASDVDLLKAIPTDATEYAPRGTIIDDSARGTIFWEAERDESEAGSDVESETTSEKSVATEEEVKTWGKPFKLKWLSTTRLPFFRTKGLRNPWNSNREVKIARDGTEIEPSVGRRLIGLFNRVPNSTSFAPADRAPMNFAPVYLPMRPFQ